MVEAELVVVGGGNRREVGGTEGKTGEEQRAERGDRSSRSLSPLELYRLAQAMHTLRVDAACEARRCARVLRVRTLLILKPARNCGERRREESDGEQRCRRVRNESANVMQRSVRESTLSWHTRSGVGKGWVYGLGASGEELEE